MKISELSDQERSRVFMICGALRIDHVRVKESDSVLRFLEVAYDQIIDNSLAVRKAFNHLKSVDP